MTNSFHIGAQFGSWESKVKQNKNFKSETCFENYITIPSMINFCLKFIAIFYWILIMIVVLITIFWRNPYKPVTAAGDFFTFLYFPGNTCIRNSCAESVKNCRQFVMCVFRMQIFVPRLFRTACFLSPYISSVLLSVQHFSVQIFFVYSRIFQYLQVSEVPSVTGDPEVTQICFPSTVSPGFRSSGLRQPPNIEGDEDRLKSILSMQRP